MTNIILALFAVALVIAEGSIVMSGLSAGHQVTVAADRINAVEAAEATDLKHYDEELRK